MVVVVPAFCFSFARSLLALCTFRFISGLGAGMATAILINVSHSASAKRAALLGSLALVTGDRPGARADDQQCLLSAGVLVGVVQFTLTHFMRPEFSLVLGLIVHVFSMLIMTMALERGSVTSLALSGISYGALFVGGAILVNKMSLAAPGWRADKMGVFSALFTAIHRYFHFHGYISYSLHWHYGHCC